MEKQIECLGTKVIFADGFSSLSGEIEKLDSPVLWVCDSNTARMVRPLPEPNVILQPGTASKHWPSVERILSVAVENSFPKNGTFLALGGGVITDVTGFAASIYHRGCKLAFIPTTLVAMSDACLGGSQNIDFLDKHDVVGGFYPAHTVIVCTEILQSLSEHDFMNGLGEIIKFAFLSDSEDLLRVLIVDKKNVFRHDRQTLQNIIEQSLSIKKKFLEKDIDAATGKCKAMSLGHPLAYALENLRRNQFSHGQAEVWGLCRSMEIATETNVCDKYFADTVTKLCRSFGYDTDYKIYRGEWNTFKNLIRPNGLQNDGDFSLVLLESQGKYTVRNIPEEVLRNAVLQAATV